jgi:hypothetical protein
VVFAVSGLAFPVQSLAWQPDGGRLADAPDDHRINLRDMAVAQGEAIFRIEP